MKKLAPKKRGLDNKRRGTDPQKELPIPPNAPPPTQKTATTVSFNTTKKVLPACDGNGCIILFFHIPKTGK
jgi:hypothetical protein